MGRGSRYPPSLRGYQLHSGTIALGTMRPRRCTSPLPLPPSSFPSFRTLILSICLSFSDSMQSSCFGNILVRIRGTAESEAIRRPTLSSSPLPPPPTPVSLDAIFTCGGGEEITVKAREFAFVEISRIPADTTPLFPSSPRPYLPFPSLPPFFRFQTQFVCLRDRISSSDLKCLSKTRKCLSCVFLPPPLTRACSVFANFSHSRTTFVHYHPAFKTPLNYRIEKDF